MGGVLLKGRLEDILDGVSSKLGIDKSVFKGLESHYKAKALTGEMKHAKYLQMLKDKTGLEQSIEDLLHIWKETYLKLLPKNEELLNKIKELKKTCPVGLISNINEFHASINYERNLFEPFEPCLLSCEVGIAKPDKRIFELALKKIGLPANECLYIDDRIEHLRTAKQLGFKTIQFTETKKAIKEIEQLIRTQV